MLVEGLEFCENNPSQYELEPFFQGVLINLHLRDPTCRWNTLVGYIHQRRSYYERRILSQAVKAYQSV